MSERGSYRSISCSLLAGKDFRQLPERARWVFVVLKMNFNFTGIETWYPDELRARISNESGAGEQDVEEAFAVLEDAGWVKREDNVVWLVGHISHDPHMKPTDPKHRKAAQRILAGLPRSRIVEGYLKAHPEWFPRPERSSMGLQWAFEGPSKQGRGGPSKGVRSKEKEKEKEMEKEKDLVAPREVAGGSGSANGSHPEKRTSWPAEGSELWSELVGPIDAGRFGRAMKPMVEKFGWPDSKTALLCYIELTEGRSRRVEWLVGDAVRWVALGKQPLTDGTGALTERGKLAQELAMRSG